MDKKGGLTSPFSLSKNHGSRHGVARQGLEGLGRARLFPHLQSRQGSRFGQAGRGVAWLGMAGQSEAWFVAGPDSPKARHAQARRGRGSARLGKARLGLAGRGRARLGWAWRGKARHGQQERDLLPLLPQRYRSMEVSCVMDNQKLKIVLTAMRDVLNTSLERLDMSCRQLVQDTNNDILPRSKPIRDISMSFGSINGVIAQLDIILKELMSEASQ